MKKKILILDDDENIRFNLKLYLIDEGFECRDFDNAESVLNEILNYHFDAAIVDIRLPKMNGEEFIMAVHKTQPAMKFLIYTGSTDYRVPDEIRRLGIKQENVFHKPIKDMSTLVQKLNKLISSQ